MAGSVGSGEPNSSLNCTQVFSPAFVLQVTNAGVRRPGYEAAQ